MIIRYEMDESQIPMNDNLEDHMINAFILGILIIINFKITNKIISRAATKAKKE